MSEENLHRALAVAAERARPSYPASRAWERARTRRARRAGAAAALAVALLSGGAWLALHPGHPAIPAAPASPTVSPSSPSVQQPPADIAYPGDPLGRLGDPVGVKLSTRPAQRALALFQPIDHETGVAGRIRVLGDDGIVRDLDVVEPKPTRDAWGNETPALKTSSLSPDGRTAAFAQTDQVIVVDLATATVRRYPVKGYLEHVLWASDRLFVGDHANTYEVDHTTGAVRPLGISPWDLITPDPASSAAVLLELRGTEQNLMLNSFRVTGEGLDRQLVRATRLPVGYRVDEWYGQGWQHGDQVARSGWISTGQSQGAQGVAVLDTPTKEVTHLLDLGLDLWKNGCEVLGWDHDGAVLLHRQPGELLRWQPRTGEVTGVARNVFGVVALAAN